MIILNITPFNDKKNHCTVREVKYTNTIYFYYDFMYNYFNENYQNSKFENLMKVITKYQESVTHVIRLGFLAKLKDKTDIKVSKTTDKKL